MKQVSARVIHIEQLLGELERRPRPGARNILGSWIIRLNCPDIAQEANPGQFVMVRCGGEPTLPRPFSIHQANGDSIALFFAVWEGGQGTLWLSQRQAGDTVELFGPLGNGFYTQPTAHNLLLIAGGAGIAPLCFLAEEAKSKGHSITLLLGASGEYKPSGKPNPSQHYPQERLPKGLEVETVTTDHEGKTGMVTEIISRHIDWADQIFACGPLPMCKTMAQIPELRDKPVQVSLEVRMGCGLGVCYGCTVRTKGGLKQVCRDGPVFNLNEILWDEMAI